MLRFLLEKFKETAGPLKDTRQTVGDVLEEFLDIAAHYLKRSTGDSTQTYPDDIEHASAHADEDIISPKIPDAPQSKSGTADGKSKKRSEERRVGKECLHLGRYRWSPA